MALAVVGVVNEVVGAEGGLGVEPSSVSEAAPEITVELEDSEVGVEDDSTLVCVFSSTEVEVDADADELPSAGNPARRLVTLAASLEEAGLADILEENSMPYSNIT